jgi:hypothetical protein
MILLQQTCVAIGTEEDIQEKTEWLVRKHAN